MHTIPTDLSFSDRMAEIVRDHFATIIRREPSIMPRCMSPELLQVRYVRPAPIDRDKLFLAQQMARFAMHCGEEWKEKRNNHANYLLTAAYEGGPQNDSFWNQGE